MNNKISIFIIGLIAGLLIGALIGFLPFKKAAEGLPSQEQNMLMNENPEHKDEIKENTSSNEGNTVSSLGVTTLKKSLDSSDSITKGETVNAFGYSFDIPVNIRLESHTDDQYLFYPTDIKDSIPYASISRYTGDANFDDLKSEIINGIEVRMQNVKGYDDILEKSTSCSFYYIIDGDNVFELSEWECLEWPELKDMVFSVRK